MITKTLKAILVSAPLLALPSSPIQGQAYVDKCKAGWSDYMSDNPRVREPVRDCRERFRKAYIESLNKVDLPGAREMVIDAVSMSVHTGPTGFLQRRFRVRLTNMNPYLFQYKVVVKRTPIVETAVAKFAKAVIPGFSDAATAAGGGFGMLLADVIKPDTAAASCTNAEDRQVTQLMNRLKEMKTIGDSVRTIAAIKAARDSAEEIVYDPLAVATEVQDAALGAISFIRDYEGGLEKRRDDFLKYAANAEAIAEAAAKIPANVCRPRMEVIRASVLARLDSLAFVERLQANTYDAYIKELRDERTSLGRPLLERNRFMFISEQPSNGSSLDSVTVQRRAAEDPPKAESESPYSTVLATTTVTGFRQLLSIGLGFAYGKAGTNTFDTIKQYTGSTLGDSVVQVIHLAKSDTTRMSPMLTLNATLPIPTYIISGVGPQVAATFKTQGSTFEYYAGLFVSLLDNRILVGKGVYAGKETQLSPGYSLGQRLPASQGVPTVERTTWRSTWMLTFRIY